MKSAKYWIRHLNLRAHPEGGWFRETYRAAGKVKGRNYSTAIYFLLEGRQRSALHRITSDEVWHFYGGAALEVHMLDARVHRVIELGPGNPQAVVPAGTWFGSKLTAARGFALVGCTVAPGFDFADFEIGRRAELLSQFPKHADIIRELTAEHANERR